MGRCSFADLIIVFVFVGGTLARPNVQKDMIMTMGGDLDVEGARLARDEGAEGGNVTSSNRGPKNVALFFAKYPEFGNVSANQDAPPRGVYLDFPFRSSLQSFKPESYSSKLLVVSPGGRHPPKPKQESCKSSLDRGVAELIAWARLEQMETGVVSSSQFSIENNCNGDAKERVSRKIDGEGGFVSLKSGYVGDAKDPDYCEEDGECTEPNPWGAFDVVANMRRLWFHKVANFLGFNLANEIEDDMMMLTPSCETPLGGLVRDLMRELQSKASDNGFLLVVTAAEQRELQEVVKIVSQKTCPDDTLIVVTGQCSGQSEEVGGSDKSPFWQLDPDNQLIFDTSNQHLVPRRKRELECVPVYAQGPRSEKLICVKGLWDLPGKLQNLLKDRNVMTNGKCPRSQPKNSPNDMYYTGKNDNGLNKKVEKAHDYFPSEEVYVVAPETAYHRVMERDVAAGGDAKKGGDVGKDGDNPDVGCDVGAKECDDSAASKPGVGLMTVVVVVAVKILMGI